MSSSSISSKDHGDHGDLEKNEKDAPKYQRHLLSPLLSKNVPPIPDVSEKKEWPGFRNPLSYTFFFYLFPLFNTGYRRTLQNEDMFTLPENLKVEAYDRAFTHHLLCSAQKRKAKALEANPNLSEEELEKLAYTGLTVAASLFKTFKFDFFCAVLIKIIFDVASSLNPLVIKKLIEFVELKILDPHLPVNQGVGYTFAMSILMIVTSLSINHCFNFSMICGAKLKGLLTRYMINHSFIMSPKARQKFPSGKITNMLTGDLARVEFAMNFLPMLITFPIPCAIIVALLIVNIGVSALVAVAIMVVLLIFLFGSFVGIVKYRFKANGATIKRVSMVREVLGAAKMIKFYGWEEPYFKNISEIRDDEIHYTHMLNIIKASVNSVVAWLPSISNVIMFIVVYRINPNRNPAEVFSSVSWVTALARQVFFIPLALGTSADAYASLVGYADILRYGTEKQLTEEEKEKDKEDSGLIVNPEMAIQVKNADFEWESIELDSDVEDNDKRGRRKIKKSKKKNKKKSVAEKESFPSHQDESTFKGLRDISFEIKKNEFVIITGSIGSGKSSLLSALAGFMKKTAGAISINDRLLLCGTPWVQNTTVRKNILFGEEYDEKRYKEVVKVCCLQDDIDMMAGGDYTEIGERGITLSGGQKARINLARAVYNNQNIILMDDVLSAVDARVGKKIVTECIIGYLKEKTRLLATHQLSLIRYADRVVYLNENGNAIIGSVEELSEKIPEFKKLIEFSHNSKSNDESEDIDEFESESKAFIADLKTKTQNLGDTEKGKLVKDEERAINSTSWNVYKGFLEAGFGKLSFFAVLAYFSSLTLGMFGLIFTNVWLSFWTEDKFNRSLAFYQNYYLLISFVTFGLLLACFGLNYYLILNCSKHLNLQAMHKILHAPMSYIDSTPMGRIINRFTKDTNSLDAELGDQVRFFFYNAGFMIGIFILCIVYLPWIAISYPIIIAIFICLVSYYQATAREIKRLEAVDRSFIYNNLNEILTGATTIKAFNAQDLFIQDSDFHINQMNAVSFLISSSQRFVSFYGDCLASVVSFIVCILCVTRQFHINASSAGLLISYLLQSTGLLSFVVRSLATVENEMNSAERLLYYSDNLVQEKPYEIPETKPETAWPQHGIIQFNNVSMRYRAELSLVLKNLNFLIKSGEKVGICGRTGAGKSSLMTALYRLSELDQGSIVIDGIDISTLGLNDLRSKLCIIPQDPVLFKGTIRKNLDPFGTKSDEELWIALKRGGLIKAEVFEAVKAQKLKEGETSMDALHKFHLDQQVEEEGANFSLGERQLMALARALARETKILILDEATSSVDYKTDAAINETIRTEFADCTILCIAHRLNTISKFDRIMVLDQGTIAQFDEPMNLYNADGIFREMCKKAELSSEAFVKDK